MLKTILAKGRHLIRVAVLFSLITSLAAFIWGSVKTVTIIIHFASSHGEDPLRAVELISIMDTFLIAAVLFILSVGRYELFIEDVAMPAWLIVHNLHDLKAKLVSVLTLPVTFLEHIAVWKSSARHTVLRIAISLVSALLIAFSYFGDKD